MGLLLSLLPHHLPDFTREEVLAELFQATADGFKCKVPAVGHLSYEDRLQTYALFSREQAERFLRSGRNLGAVKTRLYRCAYPLGAKLREWFAVDSMPEVMAMGQLLYQAIGVEIQGDPQGNVLVKSCYFSQFYTAPVCDLISALDDGVFSGLSGGGRLTFSQRVTELSAPEERKASAGCRARLRPREESIQ